MSRDFPDWVNPQRAASANRRFAGRMPVRSLKRAAGLLASDSGDLGFVLEFGFDRFGQIVVRVRVFGEVALLCQRTLEPYLERIDSSSEVALIAREEAAERLPDDYEPMVCAEDRLALARLVEEELLLALPLVPRSPGSVLDERLSGVRTRQPAASPFAVLAGLKPDVNDR